MFVCSSDFDTSLGSAYYFLSYLVMLYADLISPWTFFKGHLKIKHTGLFPCGLNFHGLFMQTSSFPFLFYFS